MVQSDVLTEETKSGPAVKRYYLDMMEPFHNITHLDTNWSQFPDKIVVSSLIVSGIEQCQLR